MYAYNDVWESFFHLTHDFYHHLENHIVCLSQIECKLQRQNNAYYTVSVQ